MNRFPSLLFALAAAATGAVAQTAPPASSVLKATPVTCAECGVVRSVKRIETSPRLTESERQSTAGLVASIPLGGGKPVVGSSTDVRNEQKPAAVRYEVVVRLDDGRLQLVVQDDAESLREGDKVVIERGHVKLRER